MKKHPKMVGHKVSNENTRTFVKYVHWRRSGAFIVNFEHASRFGLVFLLLTLNM